MNDKVGKYLRHGEKAGNFAAFVTVYTEMDVRKMLLDLLHDKEKEISELQKKLNEQKIEV